MTPSPPRMRRVLMVVQAMANGVCADWDAIAVRVKDHKMVLRMWVDDVEAAAKDVGELVGDLQTQLVAEGGQASLELCTSLEPSETSRSDSYRQHGRLVYLRSFVNWGVRMTPENYAVIAVVAAMAGGITPDFDAITVRVEGPKMMLRVWVDDADAAVEATNDLAFELEALTIGKVSLCTTRWWRGLSAPTTVDDMAAWFTCAAEPPQRRRLLSRRVESQDGSAGIGPDMNVRHPVIARQDAAGRTLAVRGEVMPGNAL